MTRADLDRIYNACMDSVELEQAVEQYHAGFVVQGTGFDAVAGSSDNITAKEGTVVMTARMKAYDSIAQALFKVRPVDTAHNGIYLDMLCHMLAFFVHTDPTFDEESFLDQAAVGRYPDSGNLYLMAF